MSSKKTTANEPSMLVGILLQMTDEVDRLILQSMAAQLSDAGYGALTGIISERCSLGQGIQRMLEFHVDGIILRPMELADDIPNIKLQQVKIPLVLVDTTDPFLDFADYVGSDDNRCGEMAAEHLLELGHRSFAIIDSDDIYSPMSARAVAFAEYVRSRFPKCHMNHIQVPFNNRFNIDQGALFEGKPTAVFCAGDYLSPGLYYAVEAAGRRIPGDISVVSVGGLREYSYLTPRLTVIRQDFEAMGVEAVKRLLSKIDPGRYAGNAGQVSHHLHFELGESSAPPRG